MDDFEIIDSLELFPAMELEVHLCKTKSGDIFLKFEDCTGGNPVIYPWCLDMAYEWVKVKYDNKS